MTVVAERSFDRIYLFSTPKPAGISEKTADAITERHPGLKVEILKVPLKDPTNYLGIHRQLLNHSKKLNERGIRAPCLRFRMEQAELGRHILACILVWG